MNEHVFLIDEIFLSLENLHTKLETLCFFIPYYLVLKCNIFDFQEHSFENCCFRSDFFFLLLYISVLKE